MRVSVSFMMLIALLMPLNAEAQLMPVNRGVVYHYSYENKKENSNYISKIIVADVIDDVAQTVTNLLCDYGDYAKEMFAGETSYITEWYAPGVGLVRTEEKDKRGNVLVSGILTGIEKAK